MSTIRNERSFLDQIRFSRGLRLWQVMARGLGVVAVVAIFGLLGKVVAAVGLLASLAILLAAWRCWASWPAREAPFCPLTWRRSPPKSKPRRAWKLSSCHTGGSGTLLPL